MTAPIQLVLVHPEIPANTGNIMRLAAATDVPLHLIEPLGFGLDHRELVRAGMDYRQRCEYRCHLTFDDLEKECAGARFLFLSARAQRSFFQAQVCPGDILVLGPESTGLSEHFLGIGNRRMHSYRIPMPGGGRSLNLSTAAGVAVYEALRQLGALSAGEEPTCPP